MSQHCEGRRALWWINRVEERSPELPTFSSHPFPAFGIKAVLIIIFQDRRAPFHTFWARNLQTLKLIGWWWWKGPSSKIRMAWVGCQSSSRFKGIGSPDRLGGLLWLGTLQRQFRLYIPFLGIARPQPQFLHSCVCERFIYSQDRSTYFPQQKRQTHRGNI